MSASGVILSFFLLTTPAVILYFIYRRKQWFHKNGLPASGIVVKMIRDEQDYDSVSLYPVVRFLTDQQEWIVARYDIGQYPASYHVGQSVKLLYDPANPEKFIIGAEPFGVRDWWPFAVILAVIISGIYLNV